MVRTGSELAQIGLFHHAITDALGHAPGQQRLELRNARLAQVQLAQRLRARLEHGLDGIDAVQPHLTRVAARCSGRWRGGWACCAGARGAALRGAGVRGAARPHGLCEGPEPPSRGGRPPRPSCCVIVGSRSSCCLQCQTAVSGRFAVCVSIVLQHPQGRRRTSSDDDGKPLARWSVYGGRAEACRTSCRPAGARLK